MTSPCKSKGHASVILTLAFGSSALISSLEDSQPGSECLKNLINFNNNDLKIIPFQVYVYHLCEVSLKTLSWPLTS